MKAKIKFYKKVVYSYHDTKYYESNEFTIKNKDYLDSEKIKLTTAKNEDITEYIEEANQNDFNEQKVFRIMKKIHEKNKKILLNNEKNTRNTHLLSLVTSVPLLIVSYAKIRKNKGCISLVSSKSDDEYNKLDQDQKNLLSNTDKGVDVINMEIFKQTSRLLKVGKYHWGTSKTVYFDKSGKHGLKRLITIPLFMDRVIQEAIKTVLVAIYEPHFDKMNCSFGFRPNRSVHDAIHKLTNKWTVQGLDIALKGEIKAVYDKVNIKKLLKILEIKIADKKFIKLIEQRLNYEFYDPNKGIFIIDEKGIPQVGVDSFYLWNIYMLEFDVYVTSMINNLLEKINIKTRGVDFKGKKYINKERQMYTSRKRTISILLRWLHQNKKEKGEFKNDLIKLSKMDIVKWHQTSPIFPIKLNTIKGILKECNIQENDENKIREILQKKIKIIIHRMNKISFLNENKKRLRFIYCRYADDWIILSNVKEHTLKLIKEKIKNYLNDELNVTLSDEKTLITKIKEQQAHFLGFGIKTYRLIRIQKETHVTQRKAKKLLQKVAGKRVFALIDKQRLIDRLFMKGYCDDQGNPKELMKLNNMEAFSIIEIINSIIVGLTNYYVNNIKRPKSDISRWIHIIRYACFKTLALKYKLTIRKVFKKFKSEEFYNKGRTLEDTVTIGVQGGKYIEKGKLHTLKTLLEKCRNKEAQERKNEIETRFWILRNGNFPEFEQKQKGYLISTQAYIEKSNWVNVRTKASFKLPCSICGSNENIETQHVGKLKYIELKKDKTWDQIMGLRNRRQIFVCRECYRNTIYAGKYGDISLRAISIERM